MIRYWLKIILSLMLVTAVLVVAALAYVFATFEDEDYRRALAKSVTHFTDYELIIDGSLKAHLSLAPSVTITSVKFVSDDSTDVFAFDHLTFQLSLRPLLSGILQVNRLVVDGGAISVETEEEPGETSDFDQEDIEFFRNIVLQSVALRNIDIEVKKGVDGPLIKARLDDITISDVSNHRPLSVKGRGALFGTDITVNANFGTLAELTNSKGAYPIHLEVHSKPVNFSLNGLVDDPRRWQGLDAQVKADVASMSWLLEKLEIEMPDLGRLQAGARVRGELDAFSFEGLYLRLDRNKQLELQVSGSIEDVLSLDGMKVKIAGSISDEALLKWLLPVDLYAITDLTFDGNLSSGKKGWLISGLKAHGANSHGLQVDMTGRGLLDDFSAEQPFGELDALIHVNSPDTASVQGYLPDDLPELGGAVGTVRLTAPSHNDLAVEDIDVRLGREGELLVTGTGRINKIPLDSKVLNSGIELQLEATAVRTERMSYLFDYPLPEVGPVSLQALFSGSTQHSRVSGLKIEAGTEGEFFLKADGGLTFGDFSLDDYLEDIDLTVDFSASPAAFASLIKRDVQGVGPLKGAGKLTKDSKNGVFDGLVTVGQTEITAHLTGVFEGERPRLHGKLTVPFLSLADFGITSEGGDSKNGGTAERKDRAGITKKSKKTSVLFSRKPFPLDFLKEVDLSLAVSLQEIKETKTSLGSIDVGIELQAGKLKIDPASFVFNKGFVKADFLLDAGVSPPQMTLVMNADDFDLAAILDYVSSTLPLQGNLNVYMDISSSGASPHELAANLDGNIDMIIEDGRLPRHAVDLLAVDLLGWGISRSFRKEKYAVISCGIVSLQADSGVVESKALVMDSPRLILNGGGTIDLDAETIDLQLYPKKKKKFWASVTPVHINGSLVNPSVRVIPVKSTGLGIGGVILAPQVFLPATGLNYLWEIMSKDKDNDDESPCLKKAKEVMEQSNRNQTP